MIRSTKHALSMRSVYRQVEPYDHPFHWYEMGPVDAPIVVLMHGYMAHAMAFRRVAAKLAQDYRLILPDLPAHGRDQTFKDFRVEPTVDSLDLWLQALLTSLEGPVHFVGHSLGATLGYLATQELDTVESLLLVSPGLKIPTMPLAKTAMGLVPAGISKWIFTDINTRLFEPLQWRGEPMDDFEIASYTFPLRQGDRMRFMLGLGADLMTHHDRTGEVGPLTARTLLVWGSHDRTIPIQHGFELRERMPGTQLVILEGSGHSPMEDTPEAFAEVFFEFME